MSLWNFKYLLTSIILYFYCHVVFTVAPRPVHVSENTVSAVGGTVRLECQFRGVPTPGINWAKDSYTLWSTERVHVHGETVVIDGTVASDAGLYQCWADSDAGIEYAIIRLDVERLLTTVLPTVRPSGQLSYRGSARVCRLIWNCQFWRVWTCLILGRQLQCSTFSDRDWSLHCVTLVLTV